MESRVVTLDSFAVRKCLNKNPKAICAAAKSVIFQKIEVFLFKVLFFYKSKLTLW